MAYTAIGLEISGSQLQATLIENGKTKRFLKDDSQAPLSQKLRAVKDYAEQYECHIRPYASAVAAVAPNCGIVERGRMMAEAEEAGFQLRFMNGFVLAAFKELWCQEKCNALICELNIDSFSFALVSAGDGILEVEYSAQKRLSNAMPLAGQITQAIARGIQGSISLEKVDTLLLGTTASAIPTVVDAVISACGQGIIKTVDLSADAVMGAALYSAALSGKLPGDPLILDATPVSLGIETVGSAFTPIIGRNDAIPAHKCQTFSTVADGQTSIEIHVVEGGQEIADGNKSLGRFQFTGISPAPRGVPRIEIAIDIDSSFRVKVSAKDLGSGKDLSPIPITEGVPLPAAVWKEHAELDKVEIVQGLLPVYDSLARALECCGRDDPHRKGLELTQRKLTETFDSLGVEMYAKPGEPFDPNAHIAADHIQNLRFGQSTVSRVISYGVKLDGKIIRYATVQVAN